MNYKLTVLFKRILIAVLFVLIPGLLFTKCTTNRSSDIKAIEETLRTIDVSMQQAITQKNVDSLIVFYSEDARLLPAAEPIVEGKAAIKKEWQHIFQIPNFNNKSTLTKIDVSEDGSMAYTLGTYIATMQGEDGNIVEEPGKWLTIWKKQHDGNWRIFVETYNTDVPPPDHK